MRVGQLARDRKAEAGSVGAAGDERLEQAVRHLGRHAGAGILDDRSEQAGAAFGRERHACRRSGAWRMALVSRLSSTRPTMAGSRRRRSAARRGPRSSSPFAAAVSLCRAAWPARNAARSTSDRARLDPLRHGQQLADQRVEPVDLAEHVADRLAAPARRRRPARSRLAAAPPRSGCGFRARRRRPRGRARPAVRRAPRGPPSRPTPAAPRQAAARPRSARR